MGTCSGCARSEEIVLTLNHVCHNTDIIDNVDNIDDLEQHAQLEHGPNVQGVRK